MLLPFLLLLLLSLAFSPLTLAADPPPGITTVYVKIYFIQVNKLDGVEQSFNADFYMTTMWYDNRTDPNIGYQVGVDWDPVVEFANSRGSVEKQVDDPYSLNDPEDGLFDDLPVIPPETKGHWVQCDQRYIGDFATALNLEEFPFDEQGVILKIESALYNNETVHFQPIFNLTYNMMNNDTFKIIEWTILNTTINITDNYYPVFQESYHQMRVAINLQRQATFYMFKIFLGSILLVIMNISIFALGVSEPDRMMGTITIFLALIAFLFVAQDSIPKVAYQTRLDNFMSFSFFMVFFSLMAHSVIYLLKAILPEEMQKPHKFKEEQAKEKSQDADKMEGEELSENRLRGFKFLPLTRKVDFFFVLLFSVIYAIGVASILAAGRG